MLLLAVITSVVNAEDGYDAVFDFYDVNEYGDTIWYKITSENDKTCEVTYRFGDEYGVVYTDTLRYEGEIIIPSEVTHDDVTYTVIGIGGETFWYCTQLTGVEIPSTVTYIGDDAFDFTSISSITIPASVDSLGESPFYGCEELVTLNVDDGNEYFTEQDNVLFDKNMTVLLCYPAGLEDGSYTVPESVTKIASYSMAYSKLKEITMLSVETIEEGAFEYSYFLSNIDLPSSLKSIGDLVFSEDTLLTTITIPASVDSIGDDVFDGCKNLQSINVETGNASYASDEGVFYTKEMETLVCYPACKEDKEYTVDKNCKTISRYAFWENSYITNITLPIGLDSIGGWAFGYCTSLDSIFIPSTVRVFGSYGSVFYNTTSLATLEVDNANPYYVSVDNVIFSKDTTELVAYAIGNEREFYSIPNTVKVILYEAFLRYKHLRKIEIPASVDSIKGFAFAYCDSVCILDTIICRSEEPADMYGSSVFINEGGNRYDCYEHTVLVVPDGAKEKYQSAEVWKLFKNIVEESEVTGINEINADSPSSSVSAEDRIYDLQGRRLDIMPENGVYIRGGKKYLGS